MLRLFKVFCLLGCAVALLAPAPAATAQTPQNSSLPAVTIVLPRKLVAGNRASLAALDADGHLVAGAAVEIPGVGEVQTDATGRATFTVPSGTASLSADLKSSGGAAVADVSADARGAGSSSAGAQIAYAPNVIAAGEPFDIGGSGFSGDASQDRVAIGAQSALVLAASPVSLVALANSSAAVGDAQLSVAVQSQRIAPRPVTLISLSVAGPANPLVTGATAEFAVRVAGSTKPVLVQVSNSTPEVIDLPGGNIRRLVTSGGASNSATLQVASIRPGDYSVSVHLVSVMQGAPDKETARLELIDARGIADVKWQKRLDRILVLLKRQPADLAGVRQEISKQLCEHPPARVEDSLRVAGELLAAS
jgi:hypothetical protein